ncbi:MAG TPA: hypothetical protein GX513_01630 [Firmicutes bacterium]|nr:hypothetical protein [Bacillota bacterium]
MSGRGAPEATRVFRPPSGRAPARRSPASRQRSGGQAGSTRRNKPTTYAWRWPDPFRRPGLFVAALVAAFFLCFALGVILGLAGH